MAKLNIALFFVIIIFIYVQYMTERFIYENKIKIIKTF